MDIGPAALAGLAAFALCLFAPQVLNDGDTFWHVRAGEWMLAHRQVLHHDVFSHTRAGAAWSTHEWLSEVFLALSYGAVGWAGVMLLTASAFGGAVFLLGRALSRQLRGLVLAVTLLMAIACAMPFLVARPHILALPVLVAWAALLVDARDAGRAPPLLAAALIVPWANMHGGYFFGLALAGFFGLEALVTAERGERLSVLRGWGAFGLLAGLAAFATPHGFEGILFPFKLLSMTALSGIAEWGPTDFSERDPFQLVLLALVFLILTRPLKLPPMRALLLVGMLYLALSHVRHQLLFAVVVPLTLARPLSVALTGSGTVLPKWLGPMSGAAALLFAVARLLLPVTLNEGPTSPKAALAALPPELLTRPVLNHYNYGGYLIWVGGRPFVDGRADMYGDAFMARYYAVAAGDPEQLERSLAEWRIEWTVLPAGSQITGMMDRQPGWRRLLTNEHTVVHVRANREPPAGAPPMIW